MFRDMNMHRKFMCAMILMIIIVLIVGLVGILGMSQINKSWNEIAKVTLSSIIEPEINKEAQTAIQRGERTFSLSKGVLIGAIVLSIILAVVIGIRITRDVTDIISNLKDEVRAIVKAATGGIPTTRGDPEKISYEFQDIIKGFNDTIDACIETTAQQGNAAQKVATGDLTVELHVRSEKDIVAISMNTVIASLNNLRREIQRLAKAAQEGMLSERGRPEAFQGAYAEIVQGVNEMLDGILRPIGEGNRILSLISGGNLREKYEIAFRGDHERMKDAVNSLHAWLTKLAAYVTKIAAGDLTATMPKASEEDQIHEGLVLMKNNIHALVADTSLLAKAAVEGNFATRADALKQNGDFQKIISNINQILDAAIEPLQLAAEYKERIAKGEVSPKVADKNKSELDNIFLEMIARNHPHFYPVTHEKTGIGST